MRHLSAHQRLWAVASVLAAVAAATIAGTVAELTRRKAGQIATLDPRKPFDPYYGLAEYALSVEPA